MWQKMHWSVFSLILSWTLVQILSWWLMAPNHYLRQCWLQKYLHYCFRRDQWVNSLAPEHNCQNFKDRIFKATFWSIFFMPNTISMKCVNKSMLPFSIAYLESSISVSHLVSSWLCDIDKDMLSVFVRTSFGTEHKNLAIILSLYMPSQSLQGPPQYISGMDISIIKIRPSPDCLIFIMGIPTLVRWHLDTETPPGPY